MLCRIRAARVAWWLAWPHESSFKWLRGLLLLERMDTGESPARPSAVPLSQGARLLIVRLGHLGDILHTVPFAQAVKRQRPDVRVEILVGPWTENLAKRFACFDEVLAYAPDFAQFHRGDRSRVLPWSRELAFLRELRARRYAVAIATSGIHLADQIVLRAVAADLTVGAEGGLAEYPLPGVDKRRPFDSRTREADWVCSFLPDLGLEVEAAPLSFPLTDAEKNRADELMRDQPSPRIVIAPGSGWPGKCWPVDRFAALANLLREKNHASIILVGSPDEKKLADELVAQMKRPVLALTGKTSLGESAAVIAASQLFIGNDSAPMHIAAAVGTPALSFFGPTNASKWSPPDAQNRVLQTADRCDGCIYWHCRATCQHDNRCMKAITIEDAYSAACSMIGVS